MNEAKLCIIEFVDYEALVSLTHRKVIVEGEFDQNDSLPVVELFADTFSALQFQDQSLQAGICRANNLPENEFPGWEAVFNYLEIHPEFIRFPTT